MYNPAVVAKDFPILQKPLSSGKRLVYLDSAATSQKPKSVIDAISHYYENDNANVHRGVHELGDRSTKAWLQAKSEVAAFFGAQRSELVIVRNTTEALNMVAYTWGEEHVSEGDVVFSTQMEHHSNVVPWQELCRWKKAQLLLIPVTREGLLDLPWFEQQLRVHAKATKLVSLTHISNTLGTRNPIETIVPRIRALTDAVVVLDAAQSCPHLPVDVHGLDVDFLAVSAHKMLGPMGIGGLIVKKDMLMQMNPWLFGGGMIDEVSETHATWSPDLEDRFTPGTPDVAGMVGWAAACKYLSILGMEAVRTHDAELVSYTQEQLASIPEITMVGPKDRVGSVAFLYRGVHAHDIAQILNSEGIAVRSGHHCTMPLHTIMGWAATTRASFHVYTTKDDIDALVLGLGKVKSVFGEPEHG